MVVGVLKPIIYFPMYFFTGLSSQEIKAVVLHELVHIKRHDYLLNLIQVVIENIFFFNPALLWISRTIREERENCCDDQVICLTRDRLSYVKALTKCYEYALFCKGRVAFAEVGVSQRAKRIFGERNTKLTWRTGYYFVLSLMLSLLLLSSPVAKLPFLNPTIEKDENCVALQKVVNSTKAFSHQKQFFIKGK
jgi:bla regulator protein blaR1